MSTKCLAVFGATGGLGQEVVRLALEAGYRVRAHARTPSKLAVRYERLVAVQGDLGDATSIREAVRGADAVLSCVGYAKGQDPAIYGAGLKHVIDAMNTHGVRRLLAISGAGLEIEGDATGLGRRIVIALLKVFARKVLAGKEAEWAVIRDADVDWTLVRVARMVDRRAAGSVAVDRHRVGGSPVVAYADVAAWMLEQVGDKAFIHEAPFVSGT